MKTGKLLGAIFILFGLLIVFHHRYVHGKLYNLEDIMNHEFFEAIFTAGITLLLTACRKSSE